LSRHPGKENHARMTATSASNPPSPEHIFQTLNAHQQTAALKTAIELDLFTAIDEGNHRVEQVAKRLKVSDEVFAS
jgi:hypothetical protein